MIFQLSEYLLKTISENSANYFTLCCYFMTQQNRN